MIAAQRVPPSACSTSQSSHKVRSPSASKSHTARSARPISRWISTVRPSGRPRETPRCVRSPVEAGSSEYSAVIQPRPLPRSQRGIPPRRWRCRERAFSPATRGRTHAAARGSPAARRARGARPAVVRRVASRASCADGSRRRLELGNGDALDLCDRQLQEAAAHRPEGRRVARRQEPIRPLACGSFSIALRASVSETSCAVSSAEKTSVTSRPNTRCKMGRIRG